MNQIEKDIYNLLVDLVGEPNDSNSRQVICDRLRQYVQKTITVYDISTDENINKNSGTFQLNILGQKINVILTPNAESYLFDLNVEIDPVLTKLPEPNQSECE